MAHLFHITKLTPSPSKFDMKKLLILLMILFFYYDSLSQKKQLISNFENHINYKVLLDSISSKIHESYEFNFGVNMYGSREKLFSNRQENSKIVYANNGIICIDTINLSIRFLFTGTMGSGGFSPYFQRTFYFKDFTSYGWSERNDNVFILNLFSSYDIRNELNKPIAEIEILTGENKGGRDFPDYTVERYSEFELFFEKNNFSYEDKMKLTSWLDALIIL